MTAVQFTDTLPVSNNIIWRSDEVHKGNTNKLSGITSVMKASANSRIYRQIKIWCNYFNDENDIIMWQRIHSVLISIKTKLNLLLLN